MRLFLEAIDTRSTIMKIIRQLANYIRLQLSSYRKFSVRNLITLKFRLAEANDIDEVLKLSDGVYNGYDYLPVVFHQWLKMENVAIIMALSGRRLVGLPSMLRCWRRQNIHSSRGAHFARASWPEPRNRAILSFRRPCKREFSQSLPRAGEWLCRSYLQGSQSVQVSSQAGNTVLCRGRENLQALETTFERRRCIDDRVLHKIFLPRHPISHDEQETVSE